MKNLFLISVLCFTYFLSNAQDTVRIKHTNYSTVFSISKKYPVVVEWWVTKNMVTCPTPLKRKDNFKSDPKLKEHTDLAKDYVGNASLIRLDVSRATQMIQSASTQFVSGTSINVVVS